jgi:fumarylacetoacetase
MNIAANNPNRESWIQIDNQSDFPIQNIPFGVFITKEDIVTIGTRIGEFAIDLAALHRLGYFDGIPLHEDIFMQDSLNDFIADGRKTWRFVRNRIADVFGSENTSLKNNETHKNIIMFDVNEVEMLLPIDIGDYSGFYASQEHAKNIGEMFSGDNNILLSNDLHYPVGYAGRSSSIIISGTPVRRPHGQSFSIGQSQPSFGPSKQVDLGLETAFVTTAANHLGEPIPIDEAEEYVFGMVLFNDWSARDVQQRESMPLGAFLSKNFASTISPWIITMDALEPYKCEFPQQNKALFPYLRSTKNNYGYDIKLEAYLETKEGDLNLLSETNFKNLNWTISQQLAQHTINGCNLRAGDLIGSGIISGAEKGSYGSMLELTWNGKEPLKLKDGSSRTFLEDGDTIILRGHCTNNRIRIGFGKCTGEILAPASLKHS